MAELDPLIHAPVRLQVVTTLSAVSEAEFATLRARPGDARRGSG
jgi:hypothetical protein